MKFNFWKIAHYSLIVMFVVLAIALITKIRMLFAVVEFSAFIIVFLVAGIVLYDLYKFSHPQNKNKNKK